MSPVTLADTIERKKPRVISILAHVNFPTHPPIRWGGGRHDDSRPRGEVGVGLQVPARGQAEAAPSRRVPRGADGAHVVERVVGVACGAGGVAGVACGAVGVAGVARRGGLLGLWGLVALAMGLK